MREQRTDAATESWHCAQIPNGSEPLVVCERDTLLTQIEALRVALFDLTWAVTSETENHTFGKPAYDATLDHLHDIAAGIRDQHLRDPS
jgi:hypothetical protein